LVLTALGIPILEACSTEEVSETPLRSSVNSPVVEKREPLIINLSNSNFSDLTKVGGWKNYTQEDLLLVRISDNEIRAFDNRCPHQGNRDRWEFDGSSFTCQYHFNSYSTSCSGSLICYPTTFEDDVLTISFE
jgi:nitrite reductase/ring-hydroxylating ferredoxin subunit